MPSLSTPQTSGADTVTVHIADAIERLDERKRALVEAAGTIDVPTDTVPLLATGLDLDPGELIGLAFRMVGPTLARLYADTEHDFAQAMGGSWIDGVVTGMLLAEMRGEAER